MLDTAATLFHTQGYHATGLTQVLSESGAPKGSLYFHFPGGKEQLAAEALALSGERLCASLKDTLETTPSPGAAVETVTDLLGRALAESDFRLGCPLSGVALDAAADSEPIRRACADGYGTWRDVIEEFLTGHGLDASAAARLATVVLASIEGGLLLARTQRDTAPLRVIGGQLRTTIETELS